MFMAKITGSVVSTKKEDSLTGKKLMIVQPVDANGEHVRSEEVACDSVGAGIGEYVLVARGNAARSVLRNQIVRLIRQLSQLSIVLISKE